MSLIVRGTTSSLIPANELAQGVRKGGEEKERKRRAKGEGREGRGEREGYEPFTRSIKEITLSKW